MTRLRGSHSAESNVRAVGDPDGLHATSYTLLRLLMTPLAVPRIGETAEGAAKALEPSSAAADRQLGAAFVLADAIGEVGRA